MSIVAYEAAPFSGEYRDRQLDTIAKAYGNRFKGDLAKSLLDRADGCVELRNHLGLTASLAIVSSSKRIMMSASTHSDREAKIKTHRDVLEACRDEGYASWVTIGESYARVQKLVEETGMQRVSDPTTADKLLLGLNPASPLYEQDDEGRLVVVSQADSLHPGYRQQIWHWPQSEAFTDPNKKV